MSTFVVAHGAWSSSWAWKKVRPLLRAAGHELWTPSYTGLGERVHLANPAIDLNTHIHDVVGTLEMEDLTEVILIGHSYGGVVATGVADRARSRIAQLVYLDAFVPRDGQSLLDLLPPEAQSRMCGLAQAKGEGWRVPPNPMPLDTLEADTAWAAPRRLPQPLLTFQTPLRLTSQEPPPRTYIYCKRNAPGDVFRQFAERAQREGWRYFEMDSSHNPHITAPDGLVAILTHIASAPVDP